MTLKQAISQLFDYRIKESDAGWDEAARVLGNQGQWSLSASPKKFENIIMELIKRVEKLEEHGDTRSEAIIQSVEPKSGI